MTSIGRFVVAFRGAIVLVGALLFVAGLVTACGSDDSAPDHNDQDASFVARMEMHHQRAIEVGQLAADRGTDQRVRDFGNLIVSQQTPELNRLRQWAKDVPLPSNAPSMSPDGYIDDGVLARLRAETGTVFDRDVLLASASSETGAAAMAQQELESGKYGPAKTLAASIATAPTTQIPRLRDLAAALPPS